MKFLTDDIFNYEDKAILVIPVNKIGVMGKGLAKQFAIRHPNVEEEYKRISREGYWKTHFFHYTENFFLFPTKNHYNNKTDLEAMLSDLRNALESFRYWEGGRRYPIHWPKIGCGLGGLDWDSVKYEIVGELARAERLYGYKMVVHQ